MIKLGARIINYQEKIVQFKVFAYNKKNISVIIEIKGTQYQIPMHENHNIYSVVVPITDLDKEYDCKTTNILYGFKIEGKIYPDPYSSYQPGGVHGLSQLIAQEKYCWTDQNWQGRNQGKLIIMEIHVGTFSESGNFKGIINKLKYIKELGVNTIELMPVNQTPGRWNWGYDGTGLFSVNHNYGTPDDLKELIDHCHRENMGVILDVVYNHFGPEGNYLPVYGPYFTEKYKTPWGPAVNYDDEYCEYTRQMVLDNIHYWLEDFHLDGLRLDAVQTIKDESKPHILKEITDTSDEIAQKLNRHIHIIAETDENDVKLINPPEKGGYGIDAQWMDDFHHCVHTVLTGESEGYYIDYGRLNDFEKVYKNYLYTGEYSKYLDNNRGTDAVENPGKQFVVAIQNHDQVGNRAGGERLTKLVESPYLKVAAGLMLFSAYIPMLFMGEEYGEENPFLFFTDYQDPELQNLVTEGRKKEFSSFTWQDVPDPQAEESFYKSKLTTRENWQDKNHKLFNFYRDLIKLRTTHPVLKKLNKKKLSVNVNKENKLIKIARWNEKTRLTAYFNLGKRAVNITDTSGKKIFDSNRKSYRITDEIKENYTVIDRSNMPEKTNVEYAEDKLITIHAGQMLLFEQKNIP